MFIKDAPTRLIKAFSAYTNTSISSAELVIVAGGFIRAYYAGEEPTDLDLYFRNNGDLNKVGDELEACGWTMAFESERAVTYIKDSKTIQLVGYIYGEPDAVINLFDFTIATAAMSLEWTGEDDSRQLKGKLTLHDDYFEHLAGRILVFNSSPLPLSSLKRMIKFIKRGYNICDENIIKLAKAISNQVDFNDEENLKEHIQGMDPYTRGIRVID